MKGKSINENWATTIIIKKNNTASGEFFRTQ